MKNKRSDQQSDDQYIAGVWNQAKQKSDDQYIIEVWIQVTEEFDDKSTEFCIQMTADRSRVNYGRVVDALARQNEEKA